MAPPKPPQAPNTILGRPTFESYPATAAVLKQPGMRSILHAYHDAGGVRRLFGAFTDGKTTEIVAVDYASDRPWAAYRVSGEVTGEPLVELAERVLHRRHVMNLLGRETQYVGPPRTLLSYDQAMAALNKEIDTLERIARKRGLLASVNLEEPTLVLQHDSNTAGLIATAQEFRSLFDGIRKFALMFPELRREGATEASHFEKAATAFSPRIEGVAVLLKPTEPMAGLQHYVICAQNRGSQWVATTHMKTPPTNVDEVVEQLLYSSHWLRELANKYGPEKAGAISNEARKQFLSAVPPDQAGAIAQLKLYNAELERHLTGNPRSMLVPHDVNEPFTSGLPASIAPTTQRSIA